MKRVMAAALCLLLAGCGAPGAANPTNAATPTPTAGAGTASLGATTPAKAESAAPGFIAAQDVVANGEARLTEVAFADAPDEEEAAFAATLGFDAAITGRKADGIVYFLVSAGAEPFPQDVDNQLQQAAQAWADAREEEVAWAVGGLHGAAVFALEREACDTVCQALQAAWQQQPPGGGE